eukprot:s66_g38.t1
MAQQFVRECCEIAAAGSNPTPESEVSPKVRDVYKDFASLCQMHGIQLFLDHNAAFENAQLESVLFLCPFFAPCLFTFH